MKHNLASLPIVALLLTGCGTGSQTGARIHESLERLIPPDTIGLIGLRLAEMRSSPLYDRYVAKQRIESIERFLELTGLDARRDLDEVLVAVDGNNTIALVRGRFQPADLEKRLTSAGASAVAHNGRKLFVRGEGPEAGAVAFLDASLAAAGSEPLVRATLDRATKPEKMPETLATLVRAVPPKHQAWAVTSGGLPAVPATEKSGLASVANAIAGVRTGVASADISSGLSLSINATYGTEQDARRVHAAARGILALGRLTTAKDRPDVVAFFDAFQVRLEAATLRIDAAIPRDTLDNTLRQVDSLLRKH